MLRNNTTLVQSSTKAQYEPVIVSNNGEIVTLYIAQDKKTGLSDITVQRYLTTSIPDTTDMSSFDSYSLESSRNEKKQLQGSFLKNGHLVVTWCEERKDGSGYGVYATILERNTGNNDQHNKGLEYTVIKDTYRVNTYTKSNQQSPSIATLSNGEFVIVWQSYGQDTNTSRNSEGVFGQRYSQDGGAIGPEFQVNDYTLDNQQRPVVKSFNSGKYIVAWQSFGQDGSANGVFAKLYSNDGTVLGGEFQINTYTEGNQENPSIAVLQNDNIAVLWQSYEEDSYSYNIVGQIIDSSGNKVGAEFLINEFNAEKLENFGHNKDVNVVSNTNGFVVTWQVYSKSKKGYDIYVKEYSHTGSVLKSEEKVNDGSQYSQEHPVVAAINDRGEYAIVWHSFADYSFSYQTKMKVYTEKLLSLPSYQESSVDAVSTVAPTSVPSHESSQGSLSSVTTSQLSSGVSSMAASTELTSSPDSTTLKSIGIENITETSLEANITSTTSITDVNIGNSANANNNANVTNNDSFVGMSLKGTIGVIIGTLVAVAGGGFVAYRTYKNWNKVVNDIEILKQGSNAPDSVDLKENQNNDQDLEMNNIPKSNKGSLAGTPIVSPDGSPYNSPATNSLSGSSPGSKFPSLDATPSTTNCIELSSNEPISSARNLYGSNEPIGNNEMLSISSLPDQAFSAANIDNDNIGSNVVMGANVNPLTQDSAVDTNTVG